MSKALTILLSISFSSLVAQIKNCGHDQSPTEAYEAFANAAAEGDCEAVYNGLDRDSRARLTAGLESLLQLAVAAQEYDDTLSDAEAERLAEAEAAAAEDEAAEAAPKRGGLALESLNGKPLDLKVPGLQPEPQAEPVKAEPEGIPPDPWEAADDAGRDERERLKRALVAKYHKGRLRARANKRRKLKQLGGKKLFVAMCSDKPPPLMTLYRERGLSGFTKQPIAAEHVSGASAELEVEVPGAKGDKKKAKKKKKKAKTKGGEQGEAADTPAGPPPIKLVREDDNWRVVLDDVAVEWRRQEDGRWLPLLSSSVIAVAVETNLVYSPSRAYERIRQFVRKQDCKAFYDHVDLASKRQVEDVAPMVVGLTSALDVDAEAPENGKELLMSLCESAPYQGMQLAGLLLGPPTGEQIEGSRAVVNIRPLKRERLSKQPVPTVTMVREDGTWKLHIDTLERTSPFWQKQAEKRSADEAAKKAEAEAKAKDEADANAGADAEAAEKAKDDEADEADEDEEADPADSDAPPPVDDQADPASPPTDQRPAANLQPEARALGAPDPRG